MNRCSIVHKGKNIDDLSSLVRDIGGMRMKVMRNVGVVYADLSDEQIERLSCGGCKISIMQQLTLHSENVFEGGQIQSHAIVAPPTPIEGSPVYTPEEEGEASGVELLKGLTDPPLSGDGMTVAVVGTGIRATHEMLYNRVVLVKNCTTSPDGDGFNHETGVASIILAIAPSTNIIDVKVIGDAGTGTEEDCIEGIDYLLSLINSESEYAPHIVNMSLGTTSTDRDNPLRIAVRKLLAKGIVVVASAGNTGPDERSVTTPAVERYVLAVGSCSMNNFSVSSWSSRGPAPDSIIKPDCVLFGEDVIMASSESDDDTVAKSGTSFAAPIASGVCALWGELFNAINVAIQQAEDPTQYAAPELNPTNLINNIIPNACAKPEGVTGGKDNDYGYGILLAGITAEDYGGTSIDMSSMMSSMMTLMMMTMMMGMMSKMFEVKKDDV